MDIVVMAKNIEKEVVNLRRYIHQNPELSFQEFETTKLIENYLKILPSFKILRLGKTGIVGILEGKLSGPKQTLALRADIDALPIQEKTDLPFSSKKKGIMHACGHDVHTSVLLGVAKILSSLTDEFSGIVKFIFQPAEEKPGGAKQLIQQGVLSNPDVRAIIALHCLPEISAGTVGIREGTMMASSDFLKLKILGEMGHAAHPHKCVDSIVISAHILTALQTIVSRELSPIEDAVLSFGTINGGTASNIIANEVNLSGTVRTINPITRNSMPERIKRISENIAKGFRGKAEIDYSFGCGPVISDKKLVHKFEKAVKNTLGENKLIFLDKPSMGSEDFAYYLEKVPGLFFRIGTRNSKEPFVPLHSPYFKVDEAAIITGISAMISTVFEFFNNYKEKSKK